MALTLILSTRQVGDGDRGGVFTPHDGLFTNAVRFGI